MSQKKFFWNHFFLAKFYQTVKNVKKYKKCKKKCKKFFLLHLNPILK